LWIERGISHIYLEFLALKQKCSEGSEHLSSC